MYSNGGERDKIVLLQSSLLMGFWHSDTDEHMQPWYWTGIAISLCQVLGLHRDPDSSKYNSSITDRQRHLWRRRWWSCFFRDCWVSLTLGRPLRINLNNCDTPLPSADDLLSDVDRMHESTSAAYLPKDLAYLAKYWIAAIELSKLLGAVITMNYQTLRAKPSTYQIEALEAELLQYKLPDQYEHDLTRLATFYSYHLQLQYQLRLLCPIKQNSGINFILIGRF
jgi:Fungal specific transcription factor domain